MNKPLLIVVTGSAASGKTTIAHILSNKICCPLLSRDEFKEGYLNTLGVNHNQLDNSVDWNIYDTFFEAINLLISRGISIIIEAAFQDKLWRPKLLPLLEKTEIKIIICRTNPDLIKSRFTKRFSDNPNREKFHGDKSISLSKERLAILTEVYEPVNIDAPTLCVDTTDNYKPSIEEITKFIGQKKAANIGD